MELSWTDFRFDADATPSEAQYVAARQSPDEVRVGVKNAVRRQTREAYGPYVVLVALGIGVLIVGTLTWSPLAEAAGRSSCSLITIVPPILAIGGAGLTISGFFRNRFTGGVGRPD